jgi:glycerol-3-phosphate acyltransferase PlsY
MMQQYLIIAALSYLIGSIPFAYIIVKLFARKNVLKEGSGNVGAMNSYEITRNRWIGFSVYILDFLKGFSSVLLAKSLMPNDDFSIIASGFFAVLGHNHSIFLLFRGGKGLATTSGVLLLIQPILLLVWVAIWFLFYNFIRKDMDYANPVATILTPFFSFLIPEGFMQQSSFVPFQSKITLFIMIGLIALLIVSKYIPKLITKPVKK